MIALQSVSIRQGDFRLDDLQLHIPQGAYCVLMGRTGSGKTTIIELICGLRRPSKGRILIGNVDVTHLPPGARGLGYVPQDGALFSHGTVAEQIGFALRVRGRPLAERQARVEQLADLLGISHLLQRTPVGLSGGERQRIALGRALAHRPTTIILDEPLASLDSRTQDQMQDLLTRVHASEGPTVLHISHSPREARRLGHIIIRLVDGALQTIKAEDLQD